MKVAIVQTEPIKGNIEKNVENHIQWIKEAIQHKADMIVFPELSLTGYEPDLAAELATNENDSRLNELQILSDRNGITIGVGLPTRKEEHVFVSMIIFQPNQERITYSKQYLYHTETSIFTAGTNPLVLNLDTEVISPAICYEASNKAHCEYAYQQKATMYLASVLSSIGGIDDELKKLSGIAKNYNMVTCMANYVGKSGGYECAGKSSVWNEKGELMEQLGDKTEGMIIFDTVTRKTLSTSLQMSGSIV
jgi:predicted amidohydrolase